MTVKPRNGVGRLPKRLSWSESTAVALVAVVLAGHSYALEKPAADTISSCTDRECSDCTTGNDNLNVEDESRWGTDSAYPQCSVYSSATFKGAESMEGDGYEVWWNVPQPGPGCQVIVMSPVGQDVPGTNCGNIVMAQKSAGCFYTHLDDTFMTQYCCGEGDCSKAGIDGAKRSVSSIADLRARGAAGGEPAYAVPISPGSKHEPVATFPLRDKHSKRASENLEASAGFSLTARAAHFAADVELRPRGDEICDEPTNVGDSYTKSGQQTQVTDVLLCNGDEPCDQPVDKTISVAHTLLSETSTMLHASNGASATLSAGFNFLATDYSDPASQEFSSAITNSFAATRMTDVSTTVSQIYEQVPGTTGYVWFTPTLKCQKKTLVCDGQDIEVEQCDPALLENGEVEGNLGFTTTG
ncbi:MAG: hypothetical protein Q9210_000667 [Variospora velana]